MFRRRSRDTGSSRRGGGIPPAPDVHTLVNDIINQLGEPPKGVAMMPICVEVSAPKRWVYHVIDYDRVTHTVIASEYRSFRLGGQDMVSFHDHHPMAPGQPVLIVRANFIKSIEVIREANRPEDEPVAAWTSESDLPRPEACSESVQ